jgi:hypothetical protein
MDEDHFYASLIEWYEINASHCQSEYFVSETSPKHVAFIDDIIKNLLCVTIIYMPVLICQSTTGWIPLKFALFT